MNLVLYLSLMKQWLSGRLKRRRSKIIYTSIFRVFAIYIIYFFNVKPRHQTYSNTGIVHLPCGVVDLNFNAGLFEVKRQLSCKNKAESSFILPFASQSHLICHPADSTSSFEPINTYNSLRKYRKLQICDFSLWLKNNSFEKALDKIDPKCKGNMMHDRPFENCDIYSVMFENGYFVAVQNSPTMSDTILFENFITIERLSRKKYVGPQNIDIRIRNSKPNTLKLPIKLIPMSEVQQQCRSRLDGTTIIIYRWHPDSLYHLLESLFRLHKTMKHHQLLDVPTRIINLDPLEGKQTKYRGQILQRNGINSTGQFKYGELLRAFSNSIYHMDMFSELPICFEHVVIIGFSSHSFDAFSKNSSELVEFRDFLLKKLIKREEEIKEPQQITMFSRSNLLGYGENSLLDAKNRRHILNENQIASYLREKSGKIVEIVKLNELTIREQMLLMFRTEIVISVHSAALINMLWMRPGSAIVQIHVEGAHLGSKEMLKRNHLLVRECGAPFHMTAHVELMASTLKLKYDEIFAGGTESKKNQELKICENEKNITLNCCKIFEEEEDLHRFATDFFLDPEKVWESISSLY